DSPGAHHHQTSAGWACSLILFGRPLLEDFGPGHALGLVRECVVARLLVHKHLQGKRPVPALFEQTGGQRIETAFLQSVEQMGSTLLAEPALRPVGRVVHTYVFFTADYW